MSDVIPVFYSPTWPPGDPPNGISTYVSDMVEQLSLTDFSSTVISNVGGKKTYPDSWRTQPENFVDISDFRAPWIDRLSRILSRIKTGYHYYLPTARMICSAVEMLAKERQANVFEIEDTFGWILPIANKNKVLCVTRLHGPHFLTRLHDPNSFNSTDSTEYGGLDQFRIAREKMALQVSDLVTAPSNDVLIRTREYYGLNLDNAVVIPNGIKAAMPEACWNIDKIKPSSLLFVGRFDHIKGGDIAIRVFSLLCEKYKNLELYFVGPDIGIRDESNKLVKIEQFVAQHVPSSSRYRVHLLGYKSRFEIDAMRRGTHVTLVTSRYETGGYNVLEAMAFGCPVVCSRAGGLPELITDNVNGLLAENNNPESFVEPISRLLESETDCIRLANTVRQEGQGLKSLANVAQQTLDAYRQHL